MEAIGRKIIGLGSLQTSARALTQAMVSRERQKSHIAHKNIDWPLFRRLVIPGAVGGMAGAYLLSNIDGGVARPFVMAYLGLVGVYLLWRAWEMGHHVVHKPPRVIAPLGLVGGFLDAVGGGGWGVLVTSNLLAQGTEPRTTIGTVNASEFFLTLTISATFLFTLGFAAFTQAAIGLIIGGLLAAPLGALLVKRIRPQPLLFMVGIVVLATSIFNIVRYF